MRVRFVNLYDTSAPFLQDQVLDLADHGHHVEVLLSDAEYHDGRRDLARLEAHPRVDLRVLGVVDGRDRGLRQRLRLYLQFGLGVVWATLTGRRVDLNVFLTQPPLLPMWGPVLRALRRQPYVVVVMDLYPDVAIRYGMLREGGLTARLAEAIAGWSLRRARGVFVIGRCMYDRVRERGVREEQIHVGTLWVDETTVYPVAHEDNALRRELGLDGFVVLYSGNLGAGHYFDDVIEVARRLQHVPDLKFVFTGTGLRRAEVESARERYHLDNIVLLPFQPEERLAEALSMGDVHFVSLREGYEGLMVPSKAYGGFASGRAMIYQGHPDGEVARQITEFELGTVVRPGDPDGLERAVLGYVEDADRVRTQGENALTATRTTFGRQDSTARYRHALERLVERELV